MDELTRFARRLVEQLTASKEGVNRAVPIGQIREKILPYRTHRRALMLESVEDYETVLLRLVAGERGFVRTLPPAAAKRCQDELAGANPDLGVLDELADSTIQITSLAAAQIVGDDAEIATAPAAPRDDSPRVMASEAKPSRRTAEIASVAPRPPQGDKVQYRRTAEIASVAPRPRDDIPPVVASEAKQSPREGECRHCHHAMPAGRTVVFCPWCGGRLIPFTCARCQTELDSEWRHCITCGAPVKDPHRYS
jgi:double zinc ribbon protein